jgi:hypothetical protein
MCPEVTTTTARQVVRSTIGTQEAGDTEVILVVLTVVGHIPGVIGTVTEAILPLVTAHPLTTLTALPGAMMTGTTEGGLTEETLGADTGQNENEWLLVVIIGWWWIFLRGHQFLWISHHLFIFWHIGFWTVCHLP